MRFSRWAGCLGAAIVCVLSPGTHATDICGSVSGTLSVAGSPYRATCDLLVDAVDTLTIDAGVELRFAAGTGIAIEGQLHGNGTSVSPVLITSDSAGPAPGDWAEISVKGSASLEWTTVRYGQGTVVTGTLDVADSVFELNGGLTDPPTITFGPGGGGSIGDTLFDQNAQPLFLAVDSNPLLSNLTIQLNHSLINGIEVQGGTWTVSRTWTDPDAPYAVNGSVTFAAGTTQTLEAGVIFKAFSPDDLVFDDIVVQGTMAKPVVLTSIWDDAAGGDTFPGPATMPAPGDWSDITVNGSANVDHLQVRYGSGATLGGSALVGNCRFTSNGGGIAVLSSADFSSCVFELGQGGEPAVSFGPGTTGSVTASLFDAGYQPLLLAPDANPALTSVTINLNHSFLNGVEVMGGNWTVSRTWTNPGAPYAVGSSILFMPGTVQTVDPGVVFKMFPGGAPLVSLSFDELTAPGTDAQPIVFTSLGDTSVGGDTLPGGGLPPGAAGDWGPLDTQVASGMDRVTVQYGTSVGLFGGAAIADSTFASNSEGVVVHGSASVAGSTFVGNGLSGFPALTIGPGATGSVSSSLFSQNYIPLLLGVDADPALGELTILDDHTLLNGVQVVGGSWTVSRTWTAVGAPYMPDLDIVFSSASTQTVLPGAWFKFVPFGGGPLSLTFGNVVAVGTAGQPIVFTSALDDTIAPDALVGVPDPPAKDDWKGLIVTSGGVHQLEHVRVSYAEAGLAVEGVGGTVDRSDLTSNKRGVEVRSGGFARVTGTNFVDNETGVFVDATSTADLGDLGDVDPLNDGSNSLVCNGLNVENVNAAVLPAENNFWNSVPPDPGTILGAVDVDPYLTSGSRPVLESLRVGLDATRSDIVSSWEDVAPDCGYRVLRSVQPDTGFVDVSGFLAGTGFVDVGVGGFGVNYFYLIAVD